LLFKNFLAPRILGFCYPRLTA
jgi:hypothetical protein